MMMMSLAAAAFALAAPASAAEKAQITEAFGIAFLTEGEALKRQGFAQVQPGAYRKEVEGFYNVIGVATGKSGRTIFIQGTHEYRGGDPLRLREECRKDLDREQARLRALYPHAEIAPWERPAGAVRYLRSVHIRLPAPALFDDQAIGLDCGVIGPLVFLYLSYTVSPNQLLRENSPEAFEPLAPPPPN